MVEKRKITEDNKFKEERLEALLALAAHRPQRPGPCPSAGDFAAFSDGRVRPEEREAILAHLDACPSCYREWLAVASETMGTAEARSDPEKGANILRFSAPRRRSPLYVTSGVITALAACLVVLLWWPVARTPDFQSLIDRSYWEAIQKDLFTDAAPKREALRFPWEKPGSSYGFGTGKASSEGSRAFGAGLWEGRQLLTGRDDRRSLPQWLSPPSSTEEPAKEPAWSQSPWAAYYYLGRWCVLLDAACRTDFQPTRAFCDLHGRTLDSIEKAFLKRSDTDEKAKVVVQSLKQLRPTFESACTQPNWSGNCRPIRSQVEMLVERIAPPQAQ